MSLARLAQGQQQSGRGWRLSVPNKVLAVLCLMYLVLYVDRVNIATLAPKMTTDLGLTNTQFGFAVSAFSYPYAFIQLFGGWISDRLGAKRMLLICGALVVGATMLTGFVGGLASLVAVRVALGFGEGFAFPTATRAMATWLPRERWGFAQGVTHAASRVANALTPPIIVAILAYMSWRGAFVVLGLLSLTWVVLWFWIASDDPRTHPGVTVSERAHLPDASRVTARKDVPWWRLARRMVPVTAVDFCYGWTLWVFLTWLPTYFLKNFHLDLAHSALFASGVLLGGVAGDTVGGLLSDLIYRRTGSLEKARSRLISVGMLGAFIFLLPVVVTQNLAIIAVSLSAACFFVELVVAPIWAVPMDIAPRYAGTASGMMNFGFGIAGILSPLVFGGLLDLTGTWTAPFCASIALLFVGAVLALWMKPSRPFEA
jgi:MFS family permease